MGKGRFLSKSSENLMGKRYFGKTVSSQPGEKGDYQGVRFPRDRPHPLEALRYWAEGQSPEKTE